MIEHTINTPHGTFTKRCNHEVVAGTVYKATRSFWRRDAVGIRGTVKHELTRWYETDYALNLRFAAKLVMPDNWKWEVVESVTGRCRLVVTEVPEWDSQKKRSARHGSASRCRGACGTS